MLTDETQNEVGRDGRRKVETSLTPLAFDVVLASEGESTKGLHTGLRSVPCSVAAQQFGHVGFRTAGPARIEQRRCLAAGAATATTNNNNYYCDVYYHLLRR